MMFGRTLRAALAVLRTQVTLRCLGLSALIAFAAGCDFIEADDIQYSTVRSMAQTHPESARLTREALADGILTEAEYDAILSAPHEARAAEYAADKRALIQEYARR